MRGEARLQESGNKIADSIKSRVVRLVHEHFIRADFTIFQPAHQSLETSLPVLLSELLISFWQ